ncbi:oxidoreductase [Endozoicomonas sp. OPT23]|uniref:Gfo/Idh/MocA family protein n=1 Tax=Endozoicomonas sp. OPT23 TaxID=2072845 RepID=UPI00129B7D9C|nr:Gfo/Idh/MocA family oxidoreductase [Endozoicomonas sp. OPT23]MRI35482.1 oxidoreductase [Endozoicomonas sp. OPT23]
MIRFAVIGTNWISHSFCQAAHDTEKLQLVSVYSRTLESAHAFASQYQVTQCFDDLELMAKSRGIDAVYIASPNSLHASQAKLFIEQGKHVICEKPMASNVTELDELISLAKQQNVVLFEALKTRYLPNLERTKEALPSLGTLTKVYFSYCQYSSRYQQYLDGKNPNTFNPDFSNGSLIDIGIYPLSAAIELFGAPSSFSANGKLLESGVDAHGSLILQYSDFEVIVTHSKVSDGFIPSEIQGENGSLIIDFISEFKGVNLKLRNQPEENLTVHQPENVMRYEADVFADLIRSGQFNHEDLEKTREVSRIITEARQRIGVIYPADHVHA